MLLSVLTLCCVLLEACSSDPESSTQACSTLASCSAGVVSEGGPRLLVPDVHGFRPLGGWVTAGHVAGVRTWTLAFDLEDRKTGQTISFVAATGDNVGTTCGASGPSKQEATPDGRVVCVYGGSVEGKPLTVDVTFAQSRRLYRLDAPAAARGPRSRAKTTELLLSMVDQLSAVGGKS